MNDSRAARRRPVVAAALAAVVVAVLGAAATDIGPWYQALRKPPWQPPDWLFGPAWTLIFGLAALSGIEAWRASRHSRDRAWILTLFFINGVLNILWSVLFFTARRPDWAFGQVFTLWLSIVVLIVVLRRMSPRAAWLLVPYLAWVTFAAALNFEVVRLNAPMALTPSP